MILELNKMMSEMMDRNPNWRYGQTAFNALYILDPDLAEEIRANDELDPYYWELDDERFADFWDWVLEHESD